MTLLQQFESALATAADATLMNVAPSGGFATYLQKSPSVAVLFSLAVLNAHGYLSGLEAKVAPPPPPPAPSFPPVSFEIPAAQKPE